MKLGVFVSMMSVGLAAFADPSITEVKAIQRYPWNGKVDISYKASGVESAAKQNGWLTTLKVTATDKQSGTTYTATLLTGDTSVADGTHAVVWDMSAQGLTFKSTNVVFDVTCETKQALYCVVDLSGGTKATSYPVSYLSDVPSGGWKTEHKTTKLVLRYIAPGSFLMQGTTKTTLTKPYYIGVFEVTQRQYELIVDEQRTYEYGGKGDSYPAYAIGYKLLRGSSKGIGWPNETSVDNDSFFGKLADKTGLHIDLPTEAQWEFACRAGSTNVCYWGNASANDYAWHDGNSSWTSHVVGSKKPNAYGLYDMCGNVWETCLDYWGDTPSYGSDPVGPASCTPYSYRVTRGGGWMSGVGSANSNSRSQTEQGGHANNGFRVCLWMK